MQNKSFQQFIRFLLVGSFNTIVDFTALNLLIMAFGLSQGDPKYIYFKVISYVLAASNSFILNRWWVFQKHHHRDGTPISKEVKSFAITSGIGLVLNSLVSLSFFHALHAYWPSISPIALANAGAVAGTGIVLLFNFFSYKFIVFKKQVVNSHPAIN